jgi:hypothetical protein
MTTFRCGTRRDNLALSSSSRAVSGVFRAVGTDRSAQRCRCGSWYEEVNETRGTTPDGVAFTASTASAWLYPILAVPDKGH